MSRMTYTTTMLNFMNAEQLKHYREEKLRNQMMYCYRSSELYRRKFDELGVNPNDIKTLEDFQKLPILMTKDEERASQQESLERFGHPFGMHLCAPVEKIKLTATTSGTTGTPTFTYTLSDKDLDSLALQIESMLKYAGIFPGDRILFAHALGIYATTGVLWGIRKAGALPIDVDVRAGTEMILNYVNLTKPHAGFMTPSLAEYLIDNSEKVCGKHVREFNFKALFLVGEIGVGIPEVKEKLESAFGCRVYDWIGPLAGTIAHSCDSDEYYGMHVISPDYDLYPDDLVDPETKEPLEIYDGVIGEAIYTSLQREVNPMLRFASGDIIQVFTDECPGCGFKGRRIKVVGRSDDMLIVKGANIYPAAIKNSIAKFIPEITGEMRIVLEEKPPRVTPPLKLKIEYGENTDQSNLHQLEERIKNSLSGEVRVKPDIIWVPAHSLGKALTKTPLFEKNY
ncbi:phenylacetate--CoA ligase family protein [Bacillus sp. B15-48]|uniref:phenylacetate--CoA ligase family protein n=1 Tax=Bacillus sp. B15-48 TaxID=1548601 RepID=UPI00193FF430|nr:phenylacetate--CoA ligase family protein [Bacillus sp. B15-48]MBM4761432.1 phenylacetate--CoA ligase family protein [Bacillus sp. B15-48]